MRAATLFSGFDGAGIGIQAAGFDLSWGIELDDKIAQVARDNGHLVITADILDCDPHDFEQVDALHASPPCTRASVANSSAEENEDGLKESQLDINLAMKTVEFIEVLRPRIVTIENVWGYRKFQSFRGGKKCEGILPALERLGYWVNVTHCNAADFGVPQTRRRLILRGVLGGWVPQLPEPEPWIGWYAAIEDLIPTLPESRFAEWQLERLPEELKQSVLVSNQASYDHNAENYTCYGMATREARDPALTMRTTLTPCAFIIDGKLSSSADAKTLQTHVGGEPYGTVVSSHSAARDTRAFIVSPTSSDCCVLDQARPSRTIVSSDRTGHTRAWLQSGRVVKMTPRALARFQSFPDSYKLPENNALAVKGIGNACPPLMFEKIYRQFLGE